MFLLTTSTASEPSCSLMPCCFGFCFVEYKLSGLFPYIFLAKLLCSLAFFSFILIRAHLLETTYPLVAAHRVLGSLPFFLLWEHLGLSPPFFTRGFLVIPWLWFYLVCQSFPCLFLHVSALSVHLHVFQSWNGRRQR